MKSLSTPIFLYGVPGVFQSTPYSCGAAALQAVLAYWGIEVNEDVLIKKLSTTPKKGTRPLKILEVANSYGLKSSLRINLSLQDLHKALLDSITVIVGLQAWREPSSRPWSEEWEHGHYAVLIGLDEHNVHLEDPSLLGPRGYIPIPEFLERWHDKNGVKYHQHGIYIWGDTPKPTGLMEKIK